MASRSVRDSAYYYALVDLHEKKYNSLVRLLKANLEYERSAIQLADAELRELLSPGGNQENLDPVNVIEERRQNAQDEIIRLEVLQEKLCANPWSSSVIDLIGNLLNREA